MNSPKRSQSSAPRVVTPERVSSKSSATLITDAAVTSPKKTPTKKGPFGLGSPTKNKSSDEVKEVYELINKATGFIGGNAYNSAMYGELTRGSMQQVSCEPLCDTSLFILITNNFASLLCSDPKYHEGEV